EEERKNLLNSGRVWYGEEFNAYNLSRSAAFQNLDGLDPNGTAKLTSAVLGISPVARGTVGGRFTVKVNNTLLGTQDTYGHGGGDYHDAGDDDVRTFSFNINSVGYNNNDLLLNLDFNQMGQPSAIGYLNYLQLNAPR